MRILAAQLNPTIGDLQHNTQKIIEVLAEARAKYANLVSSVDNHTKLVEAARKNLADARARQAGALSSSVIGRIDGVEAGVRPVGPGPATITAAGGVGGLILGFGLVFLFASPAKSQSGVRRDVRHATNKFRRAHFNPNNNHHNSAASNNHETVASVAVSNGRANREPVGKAAVEAERSFGLFKDMTLEEAIRSVEKRSPQKSGW